MIMVGIVIGIVVLVGVSSLAIAMGNSSGVNTPDLDDEREMIRQWQEEKEEKKNGR